MKKVRVLFILALALTMALASTSMAFAQYGPTPMPDGGKTVKVVKGLTINEDSGVTYTVAGDVYTFSGTGKVKVCFDPIQYSNGILITNLQNIAATYESGTWDCATFNAPFTMDINP